MSTKELTSVALRVFAILVAVKAITLLPLVSSIAGLNGLHFDNARGEVFYWLLGIAALLTLLVLALLIWKLSNRVLTQVEAQPSPESSSGIDEAFLLSLLGIYLTVVGLQQFGMTMSNTLQLLNSEVDSTGQTVTHVVSNLFGLVVGISLVVRPSAWGRALRWLRVAGLK